MAVLVKNKRTKRKKKGAPALFKTAKELQDKIDQYFNDAGEATQDPDLPPTNHRKIFTITGLAYFLGFESRQSFYDYGEREAFCDIINAARKRIDPNPNKRLFNYQVKYDRLNPSKRITERRQLDNSYKFKTNVSSLLRYSLKNKKNGSTTRILCILGYTIKDLQNHLESKFLPGMTWDNYGDWHIDHIRPTSSFLIKNVYDDDFKQCWALNNLQPLWAKDNIRKGSKWIHKAS